mgnify:FL=1
MSGFPVNLWINWLINTNKTSDIPIPIVPDSKPIIKVSALNIDEIFFLEAPIALKKPISLVISYIFI